MKKQFIAYLIISLGLSIAPLLLLAPKDTPTWAIAITLASMLSIFIVHTGALWYYLTALKNFQRGLKVAYGFLLVGLALFGLSQLQLPLTFALLHFFPTISPVLTQVLLIVPWAVGSVMLYFAVRKFAGLLKANGNWLSPWLTLGLALALGIVAYVGGYMTPATASVGSDRALISLLFGMLGWSGGFTLAAALVTTSIRKVISASYQPATTWLLFALAASSFAFVSLALTQILGPYVPILNWYNSHALILVPFLITSICFLRSGQLYKMVGRQYGTVAQDAQPLDIVMYAAALVSTPKEIDPFLDSVRLITVQKESGSSFTEMEDSKLTEVYLQLENYLVEKEPLRKFAREELRARLPQQFVQKLG